MNYIVSSYHVKPVKSGFGDLKTTTSKLNLKKDDWPHSFRTSLGNGMPFVRISKKELNGRIDFVRYRQSMSNKELLVFNR